MKSCWRLILGASTLAAAAAVAAIPAQAGAGSASPAAVRVVRGSAFAAVGPSRPAMMARRGAPGFEHGRWGQGRMAWRRDGGHVWRHGRYNGRYDGLYDAAGYGYGYGNGFAYGPADVAPAAGLLDGNLLDASPELTLPTKFDLPQVAGYHSEDPAPPIFVGPAWDYGAPRRPAARVAPSARIVTVGVDEGFASGRTSPRIISVPSR